MPRCLPCFDSNCAWGPCNCECHEEEKMATRKKKADGFDEKMKLVNQKALAAMTLIEEAKTLADEIGIEFNISLDDRRFTYSPKRVVDEVAKAALGKLSDDELYALGHTRDEFEEPGSFDLDDWDSSSC